MTRSLNKPLTKLRALALASTAISMLAGVSLAQAESLTDALSSAYEGNPTLQGQRASLRATDEGVSQAVSGWRPTLQAQGAYGYTETDTTTNAGLSAQSNYRPLSGTVTLNQNIFQGGQTVNSTRQAKYNVEAGRNVLTSTEQDTLLAAVQSYMNVIRDQNTVALRKNNVTVLNRQLAQTKDRFEVGELTRTDVAQSESRLSSAKAGLIAAEAQLTASLSFYARVVGHAPGTLDKPDPLQGLPGSEDEALEIAMKNNPDFLSAQNAEAASRAAVSAAKGALLPSFDVQASYAYARDPSSAIRDNEETAILGVLTIPLYQSGAEYSRVRQAKENNNVNRMNIIAAQRSVEEGVRNAWEQLRASQASITSNKEAVKASEIALEGVRQEAEVGSRTTLDVLNAEQELLDTSVSLVSAERDLAVSEYGLLSAIGNLTARKLALPVKYYDPQQNYDEVSGKWIGFGTAGDE